MFDLCPQICSLTLAPWLYLLLSLLVLRLLFVVVKPLVNEAHLSRAINFFLTIAALVLTFNLLEISLSFFSTTDFFTFTPSSKLWVCRHFNPVNSLGYRDTDHETLNGPILAAVGDSITAGQGIELATDRYQHIVARNLGSDWEPVTIAQMGWNTTDELLAYQRYPFRRPPRIVIWQYYVNDLEGAAGSLGLIPPSVDKPGELLRPLIQYSQVVGLVYWRVYRLTHSDLAAEYWQFLRKAAEDEAVWKIQRQKFDLISSNVERQGGKLVLLSVPNPLMLEESARLVRPLLNYAEKLNGTTVVDVTAALKKFAGKELVVNSSDSHPNELAHRLMAEEILKTLK